MLSQSIRKFTRDEDGGYTVWSLIWFSLYVAMGGLAVDVTDAYRLRTQLQSTADAAALAGVMSLPDETDAVNQAVAYAESNMPVAINGNVLYPSEVETGNWDFTTGQFDPTLTPVNAVRVITRRADTNANPLATNFLRILAIWGLPFDRWNINTTAVAVKYIPNCIKGGFVAANQYDSQSGDGYYNNICIHGQNMYVDSGPDNALEVQSGNYFEPGVTSSSPDLSKVKSQNGNTGFEESLREGDNWPKDAFIVNAIIAGLTDPGSGHMPDYILTDAVSGAPSIVQPAQRESFDGPYDPGHIYQVNCSSDNKILSLPTGVLISKVAIVTNCKIKASSGLMVSDVVLASTSVGNGQDSLAQNSIDIASAAQFGSPTYCSDDPVLNGVGGVEVYSAASAHVAAGSIGGGIRIVTGGSLDITSSAVIYGVAAQAGMDISNTSGGKFGLCPNGTLPPGQYEWHYRLVL